MPVLCIDHPSYSEENARLEMTVSSIKKQIGSLNSQYCNRWQSQDERDFLGIDYNDQLVTAMLREQKLKPLFTALETPYFARVDFLRKHYNQEFNYYIGKIGIDDDSSSNSSGERLVLDWRSPIASAVFYQAQNGTATVNAPGGSYTGNIKLRRRFEIANSSLISIMDENIVQDNLRADAFLTSKLLEGSSQSMKDIVQTIQQEQDQIIRRPLYAAVIVQGVAGSGKTAIGLHRIAYLIYTYKVDPAKIAVIAPSTFFLDYIKNVLPDLNVSPVWKGTMADIVSGIIGEKDYDEMIKQKKGLDPILQSHGWNDEDSQLKWENFLGSLECQSAIKSFVESKIEPIAKQVDEILENTKRLLEEAAIAYQKETQFASHEMRECQDNQTQEKNKDRFAPMKYGMERVFDSIKTILNDNSLPVCENMGQIIKIANNFNIQSYDAAKRYTDEDVFPQKVMSKFEEIDNAIKIIGSMANTIKTKKSIPKLYRQFLFSNEAENIREKASIDDFETRDYYIDDKDFAAICYLGMLWKGIDEKTGFYSCFDHIMIDEAQDLSPFELFVISRISGNGSITMLGDMNQAIRTYRSIRSWEEASEIIKGKAPTIKINKFDLTVGYRSAGEILFECNKLIEQKAKSVFKIGESPKIERFISATDGIEKIMQSVTTFKGNAKGENLSIGIISKTLEGCSYLQTKLREGLPKEIPVNLMSKSADTLESGVTILPAILSKGLEFDAVIIANASSEHFHNTELDRKILYVCMSRARYLLHIYFSKELTNLLTGRVD